jgi:hypothetical protein
MATPSRDNRLDSSFRVLLMKIERRSHQKDDINLHKSTDSDEGRTPSSTR